ncbi:hypothetical protein ACM66B_004413 [Microbotryomycetes sp. NB124-2]
MARNRTSSGGGCASPTCILVPQTEPDFHDQLLQGSESRHFITTKEFKQWLQSHPDVQLRPVTASTAAATGSKPPASSSSTTAASDVATAATATTTTQLATAAKPEPYKAPQHPTSHMLQSIPPRAPSQSSRSNILSYTLHLATSARLASYTHPNGSQTLLHRAELDAPSSSSSNAIDVEWLEAELKAQGMWRLGASLLKANRREGHLPPSVERRVALASLTEDLLVHPAATDAFSPVTHDNDVVSSDELESLATLKPLTSHDTTKLYLTTTTSRVGDDKAATSSSSVAQSLIDLKFGKSADNNHTNGDADKAAKEQWQDASALFGGGGVDATGEGNSNGGNAGSSGARAGAPHMDYRIVRQQTMRTRAKSIYSQSILPELTRSTRSFCRRHRVAACSVCSAVSNTKIETRRKAIPGQGLETFGGELAGGKRPLVELVPKFLDLSAHLLRDIRERMSPASAGDGVDNKGKGKQSHAVEMQATAAWYVLLHSLSTQACLEGYLVDGWTGTSGIETLFGVGCGVWEGRGWAKRIEEQRRAEEVALQAAKQESGSHVEVVEGEELDDDDDSDSETSDDSDESEEQQEQRLERERERTRLVDAAQQLFGSRDVAQAEFERNMRDRIHEYPLSAFENDMVDFLECTTRFLGKPALAKYESTSSSASSASNNHAAADEPDFFALNKYFTHVEPSGTATPADPSAIDDPTSRDGKRRRMA